jgi:hypothetical protein
MRSTASFCSSSENSHFPPPVLLPGKSGRMNMALKAHTNVAAPSMINSH